MQETIVVLAGEVTVKHRCSKRKCFGGFMHAASKTRLEMLEDQRYSLVVMSWDTEKNVT